MKQVTGATNNKPEIKNVSIRLRLDGHSFSEEKLDIPAKEKKTVEIEVLTGKTMLVPREVFDAKAAPALMRINGMEPTEKECILTSDPQQPVIALMAADKASVEKVRARLLRTGEFTASCLWIFRYEELAYLKVWERQTLRLAETFIAPTGEDLLFYVRELTQELQIENCEIRLEGNPTKQDGRLLREYFKSAENIGDGQSTRPRICGHARRPTSPRRTCSMYWETWSISRSATCWTYSPGRGRSATNSLRGACTASLRSKSIPYTITSSKKRPPTWESTICSPSKPMYSST